MKGLLAAFASATLLWSMVYAEGAIAKKHHDNTIGTPMYETNPYTYLAGNTTEVFDIESRKGLVVRVQPLHTYELFTEDILFCGSPVEKFLQKKNPMVLTYRIKASRMVEGIGCHELVRVDELKGQQ